LPIPRLHCSNSLCSLLVDQPFRLLCLLPYHRLLISFLTLSCLQLHCLVSLDGTRSMAGKLSGMAFDLEVLLFCSCSKTCLLLLSILVNLMLKLMRFIGNLLEGEVCAAK